MLTYILMVVFTQAISLLDCVKLCERIHPRKSMTAAGKWFALDHPNNDIQIMRALAEELEAGFVEAEKMKLHRIAERIEERRIKALRFCRWECGQTFSEKQELNEHEEGSCPLKPVMCPNDCGEMGIRQFNLNRHMRELCIMRKIQCKCGQDILAKDMKLHKEQVCSLRLVDCPKCGTNVMWNMWRVHENETCPKRLLECPHGCGEMIPAEYMERHTRLGPDTTVKHDVVEFVTNFKFALCCNSRSNSEDGCCPCRPIRCTLGCGVIIQKQLQQEHETLNCKERVVECCWKCNEKIRAKHIIDHERNTCVLRLVPCPRGCGTLKVSNSSKWEDHLSNECARRWVTCPLSGCKRRVWISLVDYHVNTECPRRVIACPEGCGEHFLAEAANAHERFGCTLRIIKCPQGCGKRLREEEIQVHVQKGCPKRIITCVHDECHERLPADDMGRHMHLECPKRMVRCWQVSEIVHLTKSVRLCPHHNDFSSNAILLHTDWILTLIHRVVKQRYVQASYKFTTRHCAQ